MGFTPNVTTRTRHGLEHVMTKIGRFLESPDARRELAECRRVLATAVAEVRGMVAALTEYFVEASTEPRQVYRVGLQSVPFSAGGR